MVDCRRGDGEIVGGNRAIQPPEFGVQSGVSNRQLRCKWKDRHRLEEVRELPRRLRLCVSLEASSTPIQISATTRAGTKISVTLAEIESSNVSPRRCRSTRALVSRAIPKDSPAVCPRDRCARVFFPTRDRPCGSGPRSQARHGGCGGRVGLTVRARRSPCRCTRSRRTPHGNARGPERHRSTGRGWYLKYVFLTYLY